jgi:hypothetical protein
LSRLYIKFKSPECVNILGSNKHNVDGELLTFRNKKDCEAVKGRYWVWNAPIFMSTSTALNTEEVIENGLLDGFLTLKDPLEETTPMIPGWKVNGKIWENDYKNNWLLHPLDNGDPLFEDETIKSPGANYRENNLGNYMIRLTDELYGVYSNPIENTKATPIEDSQRDLLRGIGTDGEITGIEGFSTSCLPNNDIVNDITPLYICSG